LVISSRQITIADEVWIATALLHSEQPDRADFTVQEIKDRASREGLAPSLRAGVETHIRQHCVANQPRDPNRLRYLYATGRGTRRLYREGDQFHASRAAGRSCPRREDIPERYWGLLDWYAEDRRSREEVDPILSLRGLGKQIWSDEHPDEYVHRLREGWN